MNTEITECDKEWLLYDGDCVVCSAWANRLAKRLTEHHIIVAPLESNTAKVLLGINASEPLNEMKVRTESGEVLGGADALVYLAKYFWWGWGVRLLARVPGVRFILRRAYAALAKRRHCLKGGCRL